MISRDARGDLCRQLESAKDDLEFSLLLAADCANESKAILTDNQYDEIKNDFDSVISVLNSLRIKYASSAYQPRYSSGLLDHSVIRTPAF